MGRLRRRDALSRLSSETISGGGEPSGGREVSYGYDAAGDLTGVTWPDTGSNALTATYAFDVLQRVTQINVGSSVIAAYSYDQYGRRSTIARNGGSDVSGDRGTCPLLRIKALTTEATPPDLRG